MKILLSLLIGSSAMANDFHFDCKKPNGAVALASGFVQQQNPQDSVAYGKLLIQDKNGEVRVFENQRFILAWGFMQVAHFNGGSLAINEFYNLSHPIKEGNIGGALQESDALECTVSKDSFTAVGVSYIGPWSDIGQDLEPVALANADLKANARCSPRLAKRVSEPVYSPHRFPTAIYRSVKVSAEYQCQQQRN